MPDTMRCCICDDVVEPPYNILGNRVYCARHYAAVNRPHPGFWRSSLVQIIGMGVFCAVVAVLGRFLPPLTQTALIGLGLFLAIVPAALWLWYFYRQDRLEPEPHTRIFVVFAVAFVLTDILGRRLVYDWFQVAQWASSNTWTSLAASILILGFTYQAISYVAIRTVYATDEFDERMDGILYGTVAGLGVATLLNLHYVIDNGGVNITPGVIRVVTTALAQASFGGVMGYFMAEAKFAHKSTWYVPLGVSVAAIANGLFSWLIREVSATGLTVEPYRSLILGLLVALGSYLVLVWLMRRSTEVTLRRAT
jgi:protease PrsW